MPDTRITPELVGAFPLLAPLPTEAKTALAAQAEFVNINRRGVVYESGATATHVYFLFEGRLQGVDFTIDGREVGLFFVEPREYCGELSLFDEGSHSESIIAIVKSSVLRIPIHSLREVIFSNPTLMISTCRRIAGRVRSLTEQRALLAMPEIPQRICAQILRLLDRPTLTLTPVISNAPTHQELAIMLNTSRETVTRVFQRLQAQGLVTKISQQSIEISDLQQLKQIAEGSIRL